ncbi:beta-lactamase-like protein 2 homolog [Uranotaenia lowii]|uniref:beta-lactamase-like protein 2 homolog n=1 Tax=Uranotaenia lowii TaxID=190385 RepID=UPI00247ACF51|nr:beta-lactamase-like protein 2 homolog [Uranotaenia lowii]
MATISAVTKISPKLIRILGCNPGPMTLQGTNTYIIGSGKRRILLDTGDKGVTNYIDNLKKVIIDERILINDIIVSHWHHDHVGGVDDVLDILENKDSCRVWKYIRTDDAEPVIKNSSFCFLENGQKFELDGTTIEVIHTPGHTTDHIVLFIHDDQSLFSADCILGEGTAVFEDLYHYMESLKVIQSLNPIVIYPGHGNIINDPSERIVNYISHRNQRETQILQVFKTNPATCFNEMDIVELIYTEIPEELWKAAAYNVSHHLSKLMKEGKLFQENGNWKLATPSTVL